MFTKRDIYLSLDISEIRAIVNLNLSQNHTVVNRLYTKVFRKSFMFSILHTINIWNYATHLFLAPRFMPHKLGKFFNLHTTFDIL